MIVHYSFVKIVIPSIQNIYTNHPDKHIFQNHFNSNIGNLIWKLEPELKSKIIIYQRPSQNVQNHHQRKLSFLFVTIIQNYV